MTLEKDTCIRYVFQSSTLFSDPNAAASCDEEASIRRFADLCRDRLRQAFPDAAVDVLDSNSEVGALQTSINDDPESNEVEYIEQLCEQVYGSFAWQVPRRWLGLTQAGEWFQVSIPALRWICKEGLLEEAKHVDGQWAIPTGKLVERVKRILPDCPVMPGAGTLGCRLYACELEDTRYIKATNLPLGIGIIVVAATGFGIPLFSKNSSSVFVTTDSSQIRLVFEHFADKIPWTIGRWAYDTYAQELLSQAAQYQSIPSGYERRECAGKASVEGIRLEFSYDNPSPGTIRDLVERAASTLATLVQNAELSLLGGPRWRDVYEKDESLFRDEVLAPLLRKMGFLSVRCTHGIREHGRDFTFSEETKFGELRHYGLQAKSGDIRGGVRSDVDTIVRQSEQAFTMPFHEPGETNQRYISTFIIAVSGRFTENAIEEIREMIPSRRFGSVYFWDREKVLSLIARYWGCS